MMNRNVVYFRSSLLSAAARFLINTLIILLFSNFFIRSLLDRFYDVSTETKIAITVFAVAFAALINAAVRFTSVRIDGQTLEVRRLLKKHRFNVWENGFSQENKRISHGGVFSSIYKRYLVVDNNSGNHRKLPLYYFTSAKLDGLIDFLVNMKLEKADTIAAKDKTFRDFLSASESYRPDREGIIAREWKSILKISLLWGIITAVLLIAALFGNLDSSDSMEAFAALFVSIICVIEIPFGIIRTRRNIKRCPEEISFSGDHLMVGDDHFLISDIISISMPPQGLESHSVYPVQRYLIIEYYDGKHKYWLGSESSIGAAEYARIMTLMNDAFLSTPGKFRIVSRRSFWNT